MIGLVVVLYGLFSAISLSSQVWYSYFVIGGTFFIGYLNYKFKNKTLFWDLEKNKLKVLETYFFYIIATISIELVGRFWLHFWYYPNFGIAEQIVHVLLIGYPFAFFFIYESFVLLNKWIKKFSVLFIVSMITNAFLHEIPNIFAWEWIYTIPYIRLEIFQINIVVILGWSVLIAVPLITQKVLGRLNV